MGSPDSRANMCAIAAWFFLDWVAQGAFLGVQANLTALFTGNFEVIMVGATYAFGIMIGMPLMGKLSDARGRRAGFAANSFLGTTIPSALWAAIVYLRGSDPTLWPLFAAVGCMYGFFGCATSITFAAMGDIISAENRPRFLGYTLGIMFLGMSIGFMVPTMASDMMSCVFASFVGALNGIFMLVVVTETKEEEKAKLSNKPTEVAPISDLFKNKTLIAIICTTWLQFFSYSMFEGTSARVMGGHGSNTLMYSALTGAAFAVTLLGPLVRFTGIRWGMATGHICRGIGFLAFALLVIGNSLSAEVEILSWTLVCIGIQILDAAGNALITMLVPPQQKGSAVGLNKGCGAFGRMLGPMLGFTLPAGLTFTFAAAASALAVFVIVTYLVEADKYNTKARELTDPFLCTEIKS